MSGLPSRARKVTLGAVLLVASGAGCGAPLERVPGMPAGALTPRETLLEDTAPKAELRMVPPEVYMRTYLQLFGGLLPQDVQSVARGSDGNNLFDSWDDYVSSLGFPDYRLDIPRQTQTNALMVASFERLGVALCDRAVEHDLAVIGRPIPKPPPPPPPAPVPTHAAEGMGGGMGGGAPAGSAHPPGVAASAHPGPASSAHPGVAASAHPGPAASAHPGLAASAHPGPAASVHPGAIAPARPPPPPPAMPKDRVIFAFEPATGTMTEAQFAERFDVLHRTFLGYPASLAPPEREPRYFALYRDITQTHAKAQPKSRFTPEQAAWAAVCYGLVRHPEFHLY